MLKFQDLMTPPPRSHAQRPLPSLDSDFPNQKRQTNLKNWMLEKMPILFSSDCVFVSFSEGSSSVTESVLTTSLFSINLSV